MSRAPLATEPSVPADDPVVAPSGHGVLAVLVGPFAPRTWLAASALVVSLVTGLIAFVAITVLVVTGIGLLAAFLVGVLVLFAALHLTRYLARWDRARIRTFFGVEITPPALPQRAPGQSFFSWQRSWVTSRAMWKPCGYQLLRGPIMVAAAAIAVATWSVSLALIALPIYIRPTVPGGTNWWFGAGTPPPSAVAGLCAAGVVLLFVAPWVTRALASIDLNLARVLLGPTRRDRLATEVTRLSVSRARVVDATDAERRRIERDLHDGVQPRLVSLAITLGRAQAKFEADPDEASRLLSAKEALSDLRDLARGIHPSVLDDRGLDAALSALVAGSPVPVSVEAPWWPHSARGGGPMRVVIADDSVLLREGIARLLEDAGFEIVAKVADAPSLLKAMEQHLPDIAVVDVRMPPTFSDEGLRAALVIRKQWPDVAVLVLSQYVEERYASELLASDTDGVGYLLKDRVADVHEFVEALERVAAGGTALDSEVVTQLLARSRRVDPLGTLTARERDVMRLMAEGRSNGAIAESLVVSIGAVEKHVANIFLKLDLSPDDQDHRRVLAVLQFLES